MMDEEEKWVPLYGKPEYEVSSNGRFRWKKNKKEVCVSVNKSNGYVYVHLKNGNKFSNYRAHKLILRSFFEMPGDGYQTCHKDGDKKNNCISNLRWGTPKDNHADKITHGTYFSFYTKKRDEHPNAKISEFQITEILNLVSNGHTQSQISDMYGVSQPTISRIVKMKKHQNELR